MGMQLQGRIAAGNDLLDGDLRDLAIVSGAGGTFLYAGTGLNGGLSVYRLYGDGRIATLSDTAYFTAAGIRTGALEVVVMNATAQLVLGGTGAGQLVRYALDVAGQVGALSQVDLPGASAGSYSGVVRAGLSGGASAYYMVETATGALAAYGEDAQGLLQGNVALNGAGAAYTLGAQAMLAVATVKGAGVLLATGAAVQGVNSYRIDAVSGALSLADSLGAADGLGIAMPTALDVVAGFGATWVILAAADSNSLSVMQLEANGRLSPADHLLDTRETRFGGVQALEVVTAGDRIFVIAGGDDDGLALFTLLPDGRLVHLQSLAHDTGLGLDNVTAIEAVVTGATIQIFVASGGDAGVSQFSYALDNPGAVIRDTGTPANTQLSGTAGDDLIVAGLGNDTLLGGAGDDILVSGPDGSVLSGGAGADLFVLRPTDGGALRITDFDPGIDQLDLSAFAMLRSPDQLVVQGTASGARVSFGTTTMVIDSRDGAPLAVTDLWRDGVFTTPDRAIGLNAPAPELSGGAGGDVVMSGAEGGVLSGGAGADLFVLAPSTGTLRITDFEPGIDRLDLSALGLLTSPDQLSLQGTASGARIGYGTTTMVIDSRDGAPLDPVALWDSADHLPVTPAAAVIYGTQGSDALSGGAGNDTMMGGNGADVLSGGGGNDALFGDLHADRIYGGAGNDIVWGGLGTDVIWLGDGNDIFRDEAQNDALGADTVYGGAGEDLIYGDGGADRLYGGAGRDLIWGGVGSDSIWGGAGDDLLYGNLHADRIYGGAGNDIVRGGLGTDVIWLGDGNDIFRDEAQNDALGADTVYGGAGEDLLFGAGGADTLYGGGQADKIYGGRGNDTIRGGWGRDTIWLGDGNDTFWDETQNDALGADTVYGGAGADLIHGDGGADTLYGGAGNDSIWGGVGNDMLYGVGGADVLDGGAGNDRLSGGGGQDVFIFRAGHGSDVITDFTTGQDQIRLILDGVAFGDLTVRAVGADTVIDTPEGAITLTGITAATITADDFLFG